MNNPYKHQNIQQQWAPSQQIQKQESYSLLDSQIQDPLVVYYNRAQMVKEFLSSDPQLTEKNVISWHESLIYLDESIGKVITQYSSEQNMPPQLKELCQIYEEIRIKFDLIIKKFPYLSHMIQQEFIQKLKVMPYDPAHKNANLCQFFNYGSSINQKEDRQTEFKNYQLSSFSKSQYREVIKKTITSFLNSQGGTIFLGVRDYDMTVQGVDLSRKNTDELKLMISDIRRQIEPDCNQLVNVDFIPIKKWGTFSKGKWVVRIKVAQGDLNTLYAYKKDGDNYCLESAFREDGSTQRYEIGKFLAEARNVITKGRQKVDSIQYADPDPNSHLCEANEVSYKYDQYKQEIKPILNKKPNKNDNSAKKQGNNQNKSQPIQFQQNNNNNIQQTGIKQQPQNQQLNNQLQQQQQQIQKLEQLIKSDQQVIEGYKNKIQALERQIYELQFLQKDNENQRNQIRSNEQQIISLQSEINLTQKQFNSEVQLLEQKLKESEDKCKRQENDSQKQLSMYEQINDSQKTVISSLKSQVESLQKQFEGNQPNQFNNQKKFNHWNNNNNNQQNNNYQNNNYSNRNNYNNYQQQNQQQYQSDKRNKMQNNDNQEINNHSNQIRQNQNQNQEQFQQVQQQQQLPQQPYTQIFQKPENQNVEANKYNQSYDNNSQWKKQENQNQGGHKKYQNFQKNSHEQRDNQEGENKKQKDHSNERKDYEDNSQNSSKSNEIKNQQKNLEKLKEEEDGFQVVGENNKIKKNKNNNKYKSNKVIYAAVEDPGLEKAIKESKQESQISSQNQFNELSQVFDKDTNPVFSVQKKDISQKGQDKCKQQVIKEEEEDIEESKHESNFKIPDDVDLMTKAEYQQIKHSIIITFGYEHTLSSGLKIIKEICKGELEQVKLGKEKKMICLFFQNKILFKKCWNIIAKKTGPLAGCTKEFQFIKLLFKDGDNQVALSFNSEYESLEDIKLGQQTPLVYLDNIKKVDKYEEEEISKMFSCQQVIQAQNGYLLATQQDNIFNIPNKKIKKLQQNKEKQHIGKVIGNTISIKDIQQLQSILDIIQKNMVDSFLFSELKLVINENKQEVELKFESAIDAYLAYSILQDNKMKKISEFFKNKIKNIEIEQIIPIPFILNDE